MNVGVTVTIAMIAMVQLWGAGAFSRAKFTHFKRGLKSRSHATNCDDNELFYEGFEGPKASLGDMVAGIENNELGINVGWPLYYSWAGFVCVCVRRCR